jgi:hypothetical protein
MFRNPAPVAEPAPDAIERPAEVAVPLSHLSLDVDEPPVGWDAFLAGRGIPIVLDHIGRLSISSADARQLLTERREDEIRRREVAARQEAQAIAADQARRARLPRGMPADIVRDGLTPAEALVMVGESSAPRAKSVHEQLLERELSHRSEPELVYQSIGPDEG